MEKTSTAQRVLSWGGFIVIIGLIIWGLIAAEKKSASESAQLVLPTEIVESDHSRGNVNASTTLVEYGDFQCPACGAYYPMVEKTLADVGPNNVRMVFRNFPLQQHENAVPAAMAAEAANFQGKYWDMFHVLYERQDSWATSTDPKAVFTGYAKELGLDTTKFASDYESAAVKEKISLDYKGGVKAGINATPTFFVNGKQITNPSSIDEFKQLLTSSTTSIAF